LPSEAKISNAKLVKEYACPNPQAEIKIVANLKDKYMEMKDSQPLTIKHRFRHFRRICAFC
jgi:hypothetical protein